MTKTEFIKQLRAARKRGATIPAKEDNAAWAIHCCRAKNPPIDWRATQPINFIRRFDRRLAKRAGAIWQDGTLYPVIDRAHRMYLLHEEGWWQYSRSFGARYRQFSFLCGYDDGGFFTHRVPGQIKTIAAALEYLVPAEVRKAQAAGKRVERQGDWYAVEQSRDGKIPNMGHHEWNPETRTLTHIGGHAEIYIPWKCKFVQQKAIANISD
ncbi:MAG: hypothetical protein PHN89_03950 [Candidatus Pacebacteria bacterium]|nr:hypothetical protein [Candidatus Paceibacterota bacterium]